jgi:hypothetical protein
MIELDLDISSKTVVSNLTKQGIFIPTTFDYETPTVPSDLTAMSHEEVINLYNILVEYGNFLALQTTVAEISVTELDKQLKLQEAEATHAAAKGTTATKIKADLLVLPGYQSTLDRRDYYAAYGSLLKTLQKNVGEQAWVVKADLQRRKQAFGSFTA